MANFANTMYNVITNMKRKILSVVILFFCIFCVTAQDEATPGLEFVMDLRVSIDAPMIDVGKVPDGSRTIIPITGGTFEGPEIKGEVMSGGADYQLHSTSTKMSKLHAIYSIRTDDGVDILVDNQGVISEYDGNQYFFTTPRFEAPVDSRYAWLNSQIFVCRPVGFAPGFITLRVWRVR